MSVTNKTSDATDTSGQLIHRVATNDDADALATLINASYRGEQSKQGWTNENEIVSGLRTTQQKMLEMINDDQRIVLAFFGETDDILKGCICLLHEPILKTVTLSAFAVRPDLQARGYGKFILTTGENFALDRWNVEHFELKVMLQRPELVAFYNRRGYTDTGQRETFPLELLKSGGALRYDLERCTMRKSIIRKGEDPQTIP